MPARSVRGLARVVLAALIGFVPCVAGAHAAAASGPGIRMVYGSDASGPDDLVLAVPEYPTTRYAGPMLVVTVINTGDVPLHLTEVNLSGDARPAVEGCRGTADLAPGASVSCGWVVDQPVGAPGTSAATRSYVTATTPSGTVTDASTIRWDFYNVTPTRDLTVTPSVSTVPAPGALVDFTVQMYSTNSFSHEGALVSLRSETFGDLFGTTTEAVTRNTCSRTISPPTCSFTARIPGRPGQTFTDTLRLELSDGTGENGVRTHDISLPIAPTPAKARVRLAFGETPNGPNSTTVPVSADGSVSPVVPITVVNTGDATLTVKTLRVAGTVFGADACQGALTIPVGGHVTCRAAVAAPAGAAGTTAYFRAYVYATGGVRGAEGEAHGHWSFTAPAPTPRVSVERRRARASSVTPLRPTPRTHR